MANTDFRILLQTILDKSSINSELKEVQKIISKRTIDIMPELKTASLRNQIKSVSKEIAADFNKAFGTNLTGNDVFKVYSKQVNTLSSSVAKLATESQKVSAITKMQNYMAKNTAITKESKASIEKWIRTIQSADDLTKSSLDNINNKFKTLDASQRQLGNLGLSIGDSFKEQASKFTQWVSVTSVLMGTVNTLRKMKDNVYEFDEAITNLTMATGANKEEIKLLTKEYSKLGDELSSTVTDITISATEWLKQGKTIEETNTLIRDAMVLSKIGNLSSADSTKYLTSAMKGYKVSVEDTLSVVDKLSAVDMESATDVGGLAAGMSEVAASANLAGVSMDKLLGYLASIGEVTQSGMSETGTTLNAIFSRMGNIKLARLKDYQNSGEDLSNVETVLRGLTISLRDSSDSFREYDDVLDETAGRWSSFSEVQQRAIASAFAGTHHLNEFIILMENYDNALKYTETSMRSSGEATQKFEAYQESLAGHTERFKNSFIGLSDTIVDSEFLKTAIDGGTSFVSVLDWIIDKTGVLTPLLSGIGITAFVKNFDWFCNKNYLKLPRF